MGSFPPQVRVIVQRASDGFVAQGVDYDVSAEGPSPEVAMNAFADVFIRHILAARHFGSSDPLEHVPESPPEYAVMWDQMLASGSAQSTPFQFPRFTIRDRSGGSVEAVDNLSGQVLVA